MLFSILRQENTYSMTDETGALLFRMEYSRRAKARRGVGVVTAQDGSRSISMTERMLDIAVYDGEKMCFHVCEQPDIRVSLGVRLAHCHVPELQLYCDGSKKEGYTLYTAQGGTGTMTVGDLDGQLFLSVETDIDAPLAILALAFYVGRRL